nr:hypothetical protein Cbor_392 [Cedratvirus borely]
MDLSYDIVLEVMLNVDDAQIYKLVQTCKYMANILSENYFWKRRYEQEGLCLSGEEDGDDVVSRLHSYTINGRVKQTLSALQRTQSFFPGVAIKYTREELCFIFSFRPMMILEEEAVYRLTLGMNKKEFYFAIEGRKEIAGKGFLLRHNLSSLIVKDTCSETEMRKLLYRCYMLN